MPESIVRRFTSEPTASERFRWVRAAMLCAVVCVPVSAGAHGPAPAVLGVGAGGASPSLIRLSVGAAERVGEDWHWVCPAAWGGPLAPNMASLGDAALVAAAETLGVLRAGAGFERTTAGLRPDEFVRDSAADGDGVLLVVWNRTDGSRIVRWRDAQSAEVLREDDVRWESVARLPSGERYVARVGDAGLVLQRLDDPTSDPLVYEVDVSESTVDLRVVGDRLFAALDGADSRVLELGEDEATLVFESRQLIHGPAMVADDLAVATAGELQTEGALSLEIGPTEAWSCMDIADDASTYVCARLALYRVDNGVTETPTFVMDDLLPPRMDAIPEGAVARCTAEWEDYADHAGFGSVAPAVASESAAQAGCGVVIGDSGSATSGWLGMVGLLVIADRRRRRFTTRCVRASDHAG